MRSLVYLAPLLALGLTACSPEPTSSPAPTTTTPAASSATPDVVPQPPLAPNTQAPEATPQHKTLHLVGPMDLTITVETSDNFETATMVDNSDRRITLRSVPAASGMRLESANGEVLHLKGSEGYVELVPGSQISVQEFQR